MELTGYPVMTEVISARKTTARICQLQTYTERARVSVAFFTSSLIDELKTPGGRAVQPATTSPFNEVPHGIPLSPYFFRFYLPPTSFYALITLRSTFHSAYTFPHFSPFLFLYRNPLQSCLPLAYITSPHLPPPASKSIMCRYTQPIRAVEKFIIQFVHFR